MVKWGGGGGGGGVLTIQEQMVEIPHQRPGKLNIFPVLSIFSHLSFPKILHVHPHKNFIFEINKDKSITSQSSVLKLKIVVPGSI